MRLLIIAVATLALLAGLLLLGRYVKYSPTTAPRMPSQASGPVRRIVEHSSDEHALPVPDVHSLADVQRDERSLITRARETRMLRRDDMAILHHEIDALGLDEETRLRSHRELSERLRILSRELELAPTQNELARLLGEIHTHRPGTERDRLVASYSMTARSLPPMHRSDALSKLYAELR